MFVDHYETLQISPNADAETIRRVYRLQAQRFHPDNLETGNAEMFRRISEAYEILIDPERRASKPPISSLPQPRRRWRMKCSAARRSYGCSTGTGSPIRGSPV